MKTTVKQKIIGAILLIAILAIVIPLFISPNNSIQHMQSLPPKPPAAPKINLTLPSLPKETAVSKVTTKPSVLSTISKKIDHIKDSSKLTDHHKILLDWHSHHGQTTDNKVVVPPSAWRLKLGSFSNKANALKLVKLLKEHHFDGYYLVLHGKSHAWYQVFIGPTVSKLEAKMMRQHLLDQLGLPSLLVQVKVKK